MNLAYEAATADLSDVNMIDPYHLEAYGKTVLTAIYTENGAETGDAVEWTFTGAAEDSYTAEVDGSTATVYCWGGSVKPLTVTAACKGKSMSTDITLEGW